jgi:hypothetical protein
MRINHGLPPLTLSVAVRPPITLAPQRPPIHDTLMLRAA